MARSSARLVEATLALATRLLDGLRLVALAFVALAWDRVKLCAIAHVNELELAAHIADGVDRRRLAVVLASPGGHQRQQLLRSHFQAGFAAQVIPRFAAEELAERPLLAAAQRPAPQNLGDVRLHAKRVSRFVIYARINGREVLVDEVLNDVDTLRIDSVALEAHEVALDPLLDRVLRDTAEEALRHKELDVVLVPIALRAVAVFHCYADVLEEHRVAAVAMPRPLHDGANRERKALTLRLLDEFRLRLRALRTMQGHDGTRPTV